MNKKQISKHNIPIDWTKMIGKDCWVYELTKVSDALVYAPTQNTTPIKLCIDSIYKTETGDVCPAFDGESSYGELNAVEPCEWSTAILQVGEFPENVLVKSVDDGEYVDAIVKLRNGSVVCESTGHVMLIDDGDYQILTPPDAYYDGVEAECGPTTEAYAYRDYRDCRDVIDPILDETGKLAVYDDAGAYAGWTDKDGTNFVSIADDHTGPEDAIPRKSTLKPTASPTPDEGLARITDASKNPDYEDILTNGTIVHIIAVEYNITEVEFAGSTFMILNDSYEPWCKDQTPMEYLEFLEWRQQNMNEMVKATYIHKSDLSSFPVVLMDFAAGILNVKGREYQDFCFIPEWVITDGIPNENSDWCLLSKDDRVSQ